VASPISTNFLCVVQFAGDTSKIRRCDIKKATMTAAVAAVTCALLIVSGCPGGLIGSGNLETETYAFTDFTEVEVGSAFEFEIQQSGSYNISITADDNVMEYVQVSQVGQTLKIGLGRVGPLGLVTLRASVAMPQLLGLTVSGATRGTISDFISTEDLNIGVSGASRVAGDITAGNVGFEISGASSIQLEGSANNMDATASGASHLNLDDFTVNNADVHLSGASSGTVNLNGRLDADLSGASTLWYIGEPTMGTINVADSSLSEK
jgi:hypothetical protein